MSRDRERLTRFRSTTPHPIPPNMKLTTALAAAALVAVSTSADAFTFDFVANVGQALPPNLVIDVPGYGDVEISPLGGSTLQVGTQFMSGGSPAASLEFTSGDVISVKFLGALLTDVDFDFVDVSPGEGFAVNGTPNEFTVQLNGIGNGAGLKEVTFQAVPEPGSAVLGLASLGLLALRRRR